MKRTTMAYLAGAMDSDGSFGIKRSTYAMRVRGDATQPVYSPRCSLKQVTPQIPELLKETFGGQCRPEPPSTENGRPLWSWSTTARQAAACATALLPFLLIKAPQARLIIELRKSISESKFQQIAYWFAQENPHWRKMPMLTYREVCARLNYTKPEMVSQAVRNGSLLALPRLGVGIESPRIPEPLVTIYAVHAARSSGHGMVRPPQLIAWRERLWLECRELNKIGVGIHPIYARTGPYTMK